MAAIPRYCKACKKELDDPKKNCCNRSCASMYRHMQSKHKVADSRDEDDMADNLQWWGTPEQLMEHMGWDKRKPAKYRPPHKDESGRWNRSAMAEAETYERTKKGSP